MSEQPTTQKALPDDPFMVVRQARAALKARREDLEGQVKERGGKAYAPPALASVVQYEQAARRMMSTEDPWAAAANTTKRLTWLARKSALLFVAGRQVETLLKSQDKLQRIADKDPAAMQQWADQIVQLHKWTEVLANKPEGDPLPNIERRQSKRVGLSKLPDDWREVLVARMPTWRPQAMVQAVTGCRPGEIGLGILLLVQKGHLLAQIKGKKTGLYSGQETRVMSWPLLDAGPLVHDLADMVKKAGGELVVNYSTHSNSNPERAFSGAMRQAAARAFPGHKVTITPYSMRHAMSSDLKASGLSSQEQSAALGHQVVETKSTYGHQKMAKGKSVAPSRVVASTAVRGEPSKPPSFSNKPGPSKDKSKAEKPA